jgi:hypothetical protein
MMSLRNKLRECLGLYIGRRSRRIRHTEVQMTRKIASLEYSIRIHAARLSSGLEQL